MLSDSNAIAEMQLTYEQKKTKTMRVQAELDKVTMDASEKSLEVGQVISSVSNILERCEESFRVRHNKPLVDRGAEKPMEATERFYRTKAKLDEVAMFMIDYGDIIRDFSSVSQDYAGFNSAATPASGKTRPGKDSGTAAAAAAAVSASSVADASKGDNSKSQAGSDSKYLE